MWIAIQPKYGHFNAITDGRVYTIIPQGTEVPDTDGEMLLQTYPQLYAIAASANQSGQGVNSNSGDCGCNKN